MIFDRVKENIKENIRVKEAGGVNAIPWLRLPKFSSVLPGVMKKTFYEVTANSKVGKSQLTDFLFILEPLHFMMMYPDSNVDIELDYFLLEMSKEEKITILISHYLYVNHGVRKEPAALLEMYQKRTLEDEILKVIESDEMEQLFTFLEDKIHIHDHIRNPYGIYKEMQHKAYDNGSYVDDKGYKIDINEIKKGNKDVLGKISHYQPNNTEKTRIVLTDHLSLLSPEKSHNYSLHAAIDDFSSKRCLEMKKKWGYTIVNVHQQTAEQEKQQFNYKGQSIIEKLKPSPDGLADNKKTQRDVDILIGLFAPARYSINEYSGYDMTLMKDAYRELSILLNRKGGGLQSVDLYFDGATNFFKELPEANKIGPTFYQKIQDRNINIK